METLAISVTVLILSGLGFVTYRHPILGRKIILVGGIIITSALVSTIIYLYWDIDSYYQMESNMTDYNPWKYPDNLNLGDSLRNASKDSIDFIRKVDSIGNEVQRIDHENMIKANVYSDILKILRKSADNTKEDIMEAIYYDLFGIAVLLVLFILSFQFQKIGQNNSNKNDENPRYT